MTWSVPLVLLLLALAASGTAPVVYFEQTTSSRVGNGSLGPGVESHAYHAGKRMRLEAAGDGGEAFLLLLDVKKAYRLDPERKVAQQLDVERLRAQTQMDMSTAGDLMGAGADARAHTTDLPARTVAGYACRGVRITAGSTVMDVYLTDALPLGVDSFTELLEWSGASEPMAALLAALRTQRGFPLETRTRVNVLGEIHETVATITKVRVGGAPPDIFEVPRGWTVEQEAP